ncbi:MAG TPA: SDR family NAD(P)-dependent oxidoreductase [Burkholderiaceae bacterium]|nr:SDR family NAD(P)-dependent oxidoreductase [Burkholderiaceae bacterium]
MNSSIPHPLAIVTGASSGIGFELAKLCAENGFDLIVAADRDLYPIENAARSYDVHVDVVETDLSKFQGVGRLLTVLGDRTPDVLVANAGHGLGHAFLDQPFEQIQGVIDTNITGTLYLIQQVALRMVEARHGRILVTGSVAGYFPGTFQAVYNATKAFIDSFASALRNELKDTGVSVTCLMPGATDTNFFARADMLDTKLGTEPKADPAEVARIGFEAMMNRDADVIAGWKNKVQVALASVTPASVLAEQHRKLAEPGTARVEEARR